MFKNGDKVICIEGHKDIFIKGKVYDVHINSGYDNCISATNDTKSTGHFINHDTLKGKFKLKGENMLKEVMSDAKEFVKNNRNVIYTIVMVALVDHFVFKGALRQRLKDLVDKILSKAEKSVGE